MFTGEDSILLQLLSEIKEFGRWDEAKVINPLFVCFKLLNLNENVSDKLV